MLGKYLVRNNYSGFKQVSFCFFKFITKSTIEMQSAEKKRKPESLGKSNQTTMSSFFKPKEEKRPKLDVSDESAAENCNATENAGVAIAASEIEISVPANESTAIAVKSVATVETGLLSSFSCVDKSWQQVMSKEIEKPYFRQLATFVNSEYTTRTIYPPHDKIFTALNLCPFDKVKVVVVGQDPYHGPNQAHGLAFSVMHGVDVPQSLRNIFKEAKSDPTLTFRPPSHGNLSRWSEQGVLLLNVCLTVRKGEPNSHQGKGWETFTDSIIRELSKKSGLVYLLWGKPAQLKCQTINQSRNCVIFSSHPSPLGAYKTAQPFIGSKCFSRCNEYLISEGKEPIDWNTEL